MNNSVRLFLKWFWLLLVITTTARAQKDEYVGPQEKRILDTILDVKYYDKHFRPARINGTEATLVTNRIQIHRILRLDDIFKLLQVDFTLHQEWMDDRLKFSHLNSEIQDLRAPYSAVGSIWVPDTYIREEVLSQAVNPQSIDSFRTARLFPDGRVVYSKRIIGNILCPMTSLSSYPHDQVSCAMKLSSYAYAKDDLILQWLDEESISYDTDESSKVPKYILIMTPTQEDCTSLGHNGNPKSCIEAAFFFKRNLNPFVMLIYTTTTMLIILSYLSFFLHPVKMSTARTLIALVPLSLEAIISFLFSSKMPQDSQVKAIDIWTGISLTFLFFSLLEFTIVCCLCRLTYSGQEEGKDEIYEELPTVLKKFNKKPKKSCSEAEKQLIYTRCAVWTDYAARVLYPALFLSFCVFYWLTFVYPFNST